MLAYRTYTQMRCRARGAGRQDGVVMLVALVVLVVMTLAGIGLMRSMDTSTMVAGNMAFKQAATHAADAGMEAAIRWLEQQSALNALDATVASAGYSASSNNNAGYKTGEQFWNQLSGLGTCNLDHFTDKCLVSGTAEANANGNRISYIIQRLCPSTGSRNNGGCAVVAGSVISSGNDEGAGNPDKLTSPFATVYYRITVRVQGPRNSVSYVQSIVSL